MIAIDIVGLVISTCCIGLRYPHLAICAGLIGDSARVLMTVILHGNVETLVSAGAFSIAITNFTGGLPVLLILASGPLANYIASSAFGGFQSEKLQNLIDPTAPVRHPFAVINARLALFSSIVCLWIAS